MVIVLPINEMAFLPLFMLIWMSLLFLAIQHDANCCHDNDCRNWSKRKSFRQKCVSEILFVKRRASNFQKRLNLITIHSRTKYPKGYCPEITAIRQSIKCTIRLNLTARFSNGKSKLCHVEYTLRVIVGLSLLSDAMRSFKLISKAPRANGDMQQCFWIRLNGLPFPRPAILLLNQSDRTQSDKEN